MKHTNVEKCPDTSFTAAPLTSRFSFENRFVLRFTWRSPGRGTADNHMLEAPSAGAASDINDDIIRLDARCNDLEVWVQRSTRIGLH
jgi:hypothetical protein